MNDEAPAPEKKSDSSRPLQEAAKEKAAKILKHIQSRPNIPAVRLPEKNDNKD